MEIEAALGEFLLDRQSFGRRPNTIKFYRANVSRLIAFLRSRGISEISQIDRFAIRAYFAHVHASGKSQGTVAAYDRAIRAFCRFCQTEGWLERNPMSGRPRLKPSAKLPDTLDRGEVSCLLAVCEDWPLGVRDRAIMLLMLDTGMRAGEIVSLTLDRLELDGDRGMALIPAEIAKGHADRLLPIWSGTVDALRSWLAIRPAESEAVFVSADGWRQLKVDPLSYDGLNQMMRRRAKQAGISGKSRWCHIWRHTFARFYILAGGDLETLRRLLGHSSLETVRIYLQFATQDLKEKHWRLSPVRYLAE
jgi:integrase/recombinase XerD